MVDLGQLLAEIGRKEAERKALLKAELDSHVQEMKEFCRLWNDDKTRTYDHLKPFLRDDAVEIDKLLKDNGIKNLWHFTPVENIDSIKRNNGLYSWFALESLNLSNGVIFGSDDVSRDLDRQKCLESYVRLSVISNSPMYWQKKYQRGLDLHWIPISNVAAMLKGVKFSTLNATDGAATPTSDYQELSSFKFDILKRGAVYLNNLTEDEKHFSQSEVLTPHYIPLELMGI